ncbi:MAG TPA: amidase, partial [Steroidobacteraceae bacterium]
MDRREFLIAAAAAAASAGVSADTGSPTPSSETAEELSLQDIAAAFADGRLSSQQLTQMYLSRIDRLDKHGPALGAVIEVNSRALEIAAALDAERKSRGPRGPLHGVPILIKDNVETADRMMTTAGSLALEGWYAPHDARVADRLRAAGAVILGKTNLSEWANFRSTHSSSGWSGRGGQTLNPYAANRTPSGSSSGSAAAVAANLCAIAVGTETDGSIVSPASINGIVGLKPTVGLVSRRGIVPISHSQDTAGPLARSVRDAALMLTAMAGLDAADAASAAVGSRFDNDYARYVDPMGLRGARLGIARKFFADNAPLNAFLDHCIEMLKGAGAIIIDPADLPMHGSFGAAEQDVLLFEFKADLNSYLRRLPPTFPVRSLAALIRFNDAHRDREMPRFDQELLR